MQESIPFHSISQDKQEFYFDFFEWSRRENEYDAALPHRHGYYEVIFIEEGSGIHEIDFVPVEIKTPSIHFLPIGKVHHLSINIPYSGFSLLFSADFFPQADSLFPKLTFFEHALTFPVLLPNAEEYQRLKGWLMEIRTAWNSDMPDKWEWIRSHLTLILLHSQRLYALEPQLHYSRKGEIVQKFLQLIELNHLSHWTVQDYSDRLFITPSYLNALCKKACGVPASALIQERLIQAAKRKLIYTQDSVKEIAFGLNFSDASYFTRFFRKHTGKNPGDYRDSFLKESGFVL